MVAGEVEEGKGKQRRRTCPWHTRGLHKQAAHPLEEAKALQTRSWRRMQRPKTWRTPWRHWHWIAQR
eukprot:1657942-Lingulodinium_polyedra.AAC.1